MGRLESFTDSLTASPLLRTHGTHPIHLRQRGQYAKHPITATCLPLLDKQTL